MNFTRKANKPHNDKLSLLLTFKPNCYFSNIKTVGVSAMTGEHVDSLFVKVISSSFYLLLLAS